MGPFFDRIIRAAKLDPTLYEEVERDQNAIWQAMGVVVLSSLAAGIGTPGRGGIDRIAIGTAAALLGWYIWAFLIYLIGTKILPEPQTRADLGELLRTLGFASAPGFLRILGFLPALTGVVYLGASIWTLIAMVVAVRQALDYQNVGRAVGVCMIGWFVQALILLAALVLVGPPTPQP